MEGVEAVETGEVLVEVPGALEEEVPGVQALEPTVSVEVEVEVATHREEPEVPVS
jgi:hypothetical protein